MATSDPKSRRGLTLLELVIVMVILIAVAAWTVPSIQRSFSARKLSRAADLVRSELNKARVRAMRSGDIHAFFYQEQSGIFKVAAFDSTMNEVVNDSFRRQQQRAENNSGFDGESLPGGIQFSGSEAIDDGRSASAMEEMGTARNLRPILFYPDGSSQTARIFLRSLENDVAEIRLRGMTGTSTSALVDRVR